MKIYFKLVQTAVAVFFLVICIGCTSEKLQVEKDINFEYKEFLIDDESTAKAMVTDFIEAVNQSLNVTDISLRNDFEDKEINEGIWILEGSANYIKNFNLVDNELSISKTYSLNVERIDVGGESKMKGEGMTSEFARLNDLMQEDEDLNDLLAAVVDITIKSISNNEVALEANVVFAKPSNSSSSNILWTEAINQISIGTSNILTPIW